jgi:CheY-like chemotaxis protein
VKILVVDDSQSFREIVKTVFNECVVIEAENGHEGYELLKLVDPHVIITDYQMPKMNGLEFTKKAREIVGEAVKIFMFTGSPEAVKGRSLLDGVYDKTEIIDRKEEILSGIPDCHKNKRCDVCECK